MGCDESINACLFVSGIMDLPECVAFFSGVDIDTVLRKEVFLDCITPSNPLPAGVGQTLDVHQCGELVNWTLEKNPNLTRRR
eukprot:m.1556517 g.1556517  ORF g.1556517 m.1556517 type:complete len:82 (-) comp25272_c2_seq22:3831-4076(-)